MWGLKIIKFSGVLGFGILGIDGLVIKVVGFTSLGTVVLVVVVVVLLFLVVVFAAAGAGAGVVEVVVGIF